MFRLMLIATLVAAAAAKPPMVTENEPQSIYQSLGLTQEEINAANKAEEKSVGILAYQAEHGLNEKPKQCKSYKVEAENIFLTLWSKQSGNVTWSAKEQGMKLTPDFDSKLPTQIFINDRLSNEKSMKIEKMALAYESRHKKINIISVNWEDYSNCPYAVTVKSIAPQLAEVLSNALANLKEYSGLQYDKLRLTGHGVGAHIAGLTARKLSQKPAGITALDPAGMLYDVVDEKLKLKKGDAKFIDVIYTNRGNLALNELVGDINFLPSGGQVQKACENIQSDKNACSHQLAVEYYLESVYQGLKGFVAVAANSWVDFLAHKEEAQVSEIMGEDVSGQNTGKYYLEVNAQAPYSKGISS